MNRHEPQLRSCGIPYMQSLHTAFFHQHTKDLAKEIQWLLPVHSFRKGNQKDDGFQRAQQLKQENQTLGYFGNGQCSSNLV